MKDRYGYTLKDFDGEILRHVYIVDGCNLEPGTTPEQGLYTIENTVECATKAEALKYMRRMCKKYYKVIIYDNWEEPETGCWVEQTITDYKNGKAFNSITM